MSRGRRLRSPVVVALAVLATLAACSFSSARQDVPAAPPSGPTFLYVAVGASETVGFGSDQPLRDAWPRVFHRTALPQSAQFVNMGIPGATVASAVRDELPSTLTLRPAVVTVWLNVNDITSRVAPDAYERDLATLVHALRRNGATRVLVANTPPLDHLPAYLACRPSPPPGSAPCRTGADLPGPDALNRVVDAYNAAVARVAQQEGAILVDLHGVGLASRQAGTEASFVSGDGFHPSTVGHQAVATAFADALRASGPLPPGG